MRGIGSGEEAQMDFVIRKEAVAGEGRGSGVRLGVKISAVLIQVISVSSTETESLPDTEGRRPATAASRPATSQAALTSRKTATAQTSQGSAQTARPEAAASPTTA